MSQPQLPSDIPDVTQAERAESMNARFLRAALMSLLTYGGPVAVVVHVYLFKKYFELGSLSPDGIYSVVLNNHGVNRYITEAQSLTLDVSLVVAAALSFVFFGLIVARLRKAKDSVLP